MLLQQWLSNIHGSNNRYITFIKVVCICQARRNNRPDHQEINFTRLEQQAHSRTQLSWLVMPITCLEFTGSGDQAIICCLSLQ
jgi:hypothetical protein